MSEESNNQIIEEEIVSLDQLYRKIKDSNKDQIDQLVKKLNALEQTIQDNKTQVDNQLSFLMYSGSGMGNIPTPQRRVAPGISCAEPTTARRPEHLYGR